MRLTRRRAALIRQGVVWARETPTPFLSTVTAQRLTQDAFWTRYERDQARPTKASEADWAAAFDDIITANDMRGQ